MGIAAERLLKVGEAQAVIAVPPFLPYAQQTASIEGVHLALVGLLVHEFVLVVLAALPLQVEEVNEVATRV